MIFMNVFSFDDFAANNNIVPSDRPDRFSADMDAVRALLEANVIESWHCILNDAEDPNNIPADNPMLQFDYWDSSGSNDRLICDMSCWSFLNDVLDVLPADVEFRIFYWADFDGRDRIVVHILPTYANIAEMGIDRFAYLLNSAG